MPSKTMLSLSKRVYNWRKMNEKYGCSNNNNEDSYHQMLMDVKRQIDENRQRIYDNDDSPDVMQSLGIDFVEGRAYFLDSKTIEISSSRTSSPQQITAKYGIVVGTGAIPQILNIQGLNQVSYWTYENVWNDFFVEVGQKNKAMKLQETKVIVVGGGPVGCELSQAISRLGCSVVIISKSDRLLPSGEEVASLELQTCFRKGEYRSYMWRKRCFCD